MIASLDRLPPADAVPPGPGFVSVTLTFDQFRALLGAVARLQAAVDGVPPAVPASRPAPPPADLTGLQRDALEAAPPPDQRPVTMKRLAALAGYSYSQHFRESVHALVDAGLMVRLRTGFRRAEGVSP